MTSCQHGKRSIRTNTRFCLKAETGVTLYEHESLIIFDEVQLFPQARQAIKHLVADGSYSYLETVTNFYNRFMIWGLLLGRRQIVKERIEGGANEKAVLRLFINCPFVCINFDFFWLNKARQLYMDF